MHPLCYNMLGQPLETDIGMNYVFRNSCGYLKLVDSAN